MLGLEDDFPSPGTPLPAQRVDCASMGDRDEPRTKGARRVVGVPHGVHRQQHLLHHVFDVPRIPQVPRGDRAKIRRDVLEQASVRIAVAPLGASHIDGPVELTLGGALPIRSWCRLLDESQVGTTIVRAWGHRRDLVANEDTPLAYIFCMAQSVSRSRSRYSAMHAASIGHAAKKSKLSNGARYC